MCVRECVIEKVNESVSDEGSAYLMREGVPRPHGRESYDTCE